LLTKIINKKNKEIVLELEAPFPTEENKRGNKRRVKSAKEEEEQFSDGSQSQSEEVSDNNSDNEPLSPSPEDIDDHAESQNSLSRPTDRKLRSQRPALDVKLDADKVNVNTLTAITILSF